MVYSFARIGAALGMAVEDVFTRNRRLFRTTGRGTGKLTRTVLSQANAMR
jgi:hypothetical protein